MPSDNRGRNSAQLDNVVHVNGVAQIPLSAGGEGQPGPQVVWDGLDLDLDPAEATPFPDSAGTTTIRSDSLEDHPGGDGASEATIYGLDQNRAIQAVTVVLAGLSAVGMAVDFLRILRVLVTGGVTNLGRLLVEHAGPVVIAMVRPGTSVTQTSAFSTSAERALYLEDVSYTTDAEKELDARLKIRHEGTEYEPIHILSRGGQPAGDRYPNALPFIIPPSSDVWIEASAGKEAHIATAMVGQLDVVDESLDPAASNRGSWRGL